MKAALALLLLVAANAGAEVYKCQSADGKTEFRDKPCAGAPGAKVEIKPNTVGEVDQRSLTQKREAIDKTINARFAADDAYRAKQAADVAVHREKCTAQVDEMNRQMAWQYSRSVAVRESAAVDWRIARRKWLEERCDRWQ